MARWGSNEVARSARPQPGYGQVEDGLSRPMRGRACADEHGDRAHLANQSETVFMHEF